MTTPDSDELTTLRTQLAEAESRAEKAEAAIREAVAGDYANILDFHKVWLRQAENDARNQKSAADTNWTKFQHECAVSAGNERLADKQRARAESAESRAERLAGLLDSVRANLSGIDADTDDDDGKFDASGFDVSCKQTIRELQREIRDALSDTPPDSPA